MSRSALQCSSRLLNQIRPRMPANRVGIRLVSESGPESQITAEPAISVSPRLVLSSSSTTRQAMLRTAVVPVFHVPNQVEFRVLDTSDGLGHRPVGRLPPSGASDGSPPGAAHDSSKVRSASELALRVGARGLEPP